MSKKKTVIATAGDDRRLPPFSEEIRSAIDAAGMVGHRLGPLSTIISCEAESIPVGDARSDLVFVSAWAIEMLGNELGAVETSTYELALTVGRDNEEMATMLRGIADRIDRASQHLSVFAERADLDSRGTNGHQAIAAAAWAVQVLADQLPKIHLATLEIADSLQAVSR